MGQSDQTWGTQKSATLAKIKMNSKLFLISALVAVAYGQEDNFECPDEFLGFYPHLYSCDKYWFCEDGIAELRTCGNGLAFIDTDESYKLEQCNELHLVDCGARTELEPPISTPNCPRLYGTYADPEDCGVFWNCQDGKANRYECPPGLAFDQVTHGCLWANEVPECSGPIIPIDEEGGEFACPVDEVFNAGSGSGEDGQCTDPELVPECANYYGDSDILTEAQFAEGRVSNPGRVRTGRRLEQDSDSY